MKMLEKEGANAFSVKTVSLTGDVMEVLKTLTLLEKNFGVTYLVKLLRGDLSFEWKIEKHKQFETFGALREQSEERVKNLVFYMGEIGLLGPVNVFATNIGISATGKSFLDKSWEIVVPGYRLRLQKFQYLLKNRLRNLRQRFAAEGKNRPYEIISEWALERIVRDQPLNLAELKKIQGMTPHKAETYGEAILLQVKEVEVLRKEEMLAQYAVQMKGQHAQEVLRLFNEGKDITGIAGLMQLKPSTVSNYLERLHLCGYLNLKPFLERTMDSKALYKGAEYFRQVQSPRLKQAYETLGLDYETLRMCRLYVSDFKQKTEQVSIQS